MECLHRPGIKRQPARPCFSVASQAQLLQLKWEREHLPLMHTASQLSWGKESAGIDLILMQKTLPLLNAYGNGVYKRVHPR